MKKILILLGLAFTLSSAVEFSEPDEIITALKSGSATDLSKYFDDIIDLTLPGKEEMSNMGKNQAGLSLKNYYAEAGIKSFELTSTREKGSILYITGKLYGTSKNDKITIMIKNTNVKYLITSVRIG